MIICGPYTAESELDKILVLAPGLFKFKPKRGAFLHYVKKLISIIVSECLGIFIPEKI